MHRTNKCLGCYKHWSIFVCENTENGRWTWDLISLSLRICTTDKHFIRVLVLISFSIRTMSFQMIDDIWFLIMSRRHSRDLFLILPDFDNLIFDRFIYCTILSIMLNSSSLYFIVIFYSVETFHSQLHSFKGQSM